jgi:diaminobutyrate-2-oxoglutarate transaminase
MNKRFESLALLGRPFWLLWSGQSISMLGSQLVQFALSVWIYQQTGSVLSFAWSIVATTVPLVLMSPIAGTIVDRLNRLHIMIFFDTLVALAMLVMLALVWSENLEVYHLYIMGAYLAVCSAFQKPAYQASVANMVSEDNLTRVSGAMGVSTTLLGIVAPTLAGSLLISIGLKGLFVIDLMTFVIGTLLAWKAFSLFKHDAKAFSKHELKLAIVGSTHNFLKSCEFLNKNNGLRWLLVYTLIQAAMITLAITMVIPLVLSMHSATSLGVILSFAAAGAFVGSLLLVFLNSPEQRMKVVLIGDAVLALCILCAGFSTSVIGFCAIEFIAGMASSIAGGCAYSLWMSKIPDERRGSVLVTLNTGIVLSGTLFAVIGSIIIEKIFEPALADNGALANSVGMLLGVGEGRGIAFMFLISGMVSLTMIALGASKKTLRELN